MPSRILLAASSLLGAWCFGPGAAEPPAPKQEVPAIRPLAPKRVTLHAQAIPLSKALAELVHTREANEAFMDLQEELQREVLMKQVERSEREYREGNFTTWDEVKRRNGL